MTEAKASKGASACRGSADPTGPATNTTTASDSKTSKALAKAAGARTRFGFDAWKKAERVTDGFTRSVLACLQTAAADLVQDSISGDKDHKTAKLDRRLVVFGDKLYISCREQLAKFRYGSLLPEDSAPKTKGKSKAADSDKSPSSPASPDKPVEETKAESTSDTITSPKPGKKVKPSKTDKTPKVKEKKESKTDIMRRQHTEAKAASLVAELLANFAKANMNYSYGLEVCKHLELHGITFMYCIWFLLRSSDKGDDADPAEVYELTIAVQRFLHASANYQGRSMINESQPDVVSPTMLADLQGWLQRLLAKYPFDGLKMYQVAPQLLIFTKYDKGIPSTGNRPRKNQIDIMAAVYRNHQTGFLLSYPAPLGSGKTTAAAVCLPALLHQLNVLKASTTSESKTKAKARKVDNMMVSSTNGRGKKELKEHKVERLELVAICNIPSVLEQMVGAAYNSNTKFAVATIGRSGKLKHRNHKSTSDEDRVLTVCDPETAVLLFQEETKARESALFVAQAAQWAAEAELDGDDLSAKDRTAAQAKLASAMAEIKALQEAKSRYVAFLDEPTMGADHPGSLPLLANMGLLPHLPPRVILSSATMPALDNLPTIVGYFQHKYPGIVLDTIKSNEIQIGCKVQTYNGEVVVPHGGVTKCKQLRRVVASIEQSPVMGRLYPPQIAHQLWSRLDGKLVGLVDLPKAFGDVNNLTLNRVRQMSMDMLGQLADSGKTVLVRKACRVGFLGQLTAAHKDTHGPESKGLIKSPSGETSVSARGDRIPTNEQVGLVTRSATGVNFGLLGTKQAHRFPHMSLITTNDPLAFAQTSFGNLVADINQSIHSFDNMMDKYRQAHELWDKQRKRLEDSKFKTKQQDQLSQQQQELKGVAPKIGFPGWAQINTAEHLKAYARGKTLVPGEIRLDQVLEHIDWASFKTPDWVSLLLMAGVGIYAPSNELLNGPPDKDGFQPLSPYTHTVLAMAAAGSLAYLVSDISISYGTNYPIYRVFVTPDFGASNGINTLLQVLARAGRVGKSWSAEAFLDDETAAKLLAYVSDPEHSSAHQEAENMEIAFTQLAGSAEHDHGDD